MVEKVSNRIGWSKYSSFCRPLWIQEVCGPIRNIRIASHQKKIKRILFKSSTPGCTLCGRDIGGPTSCKKCKTLLCHSCLPLHIFRARYSSWYGPCCPHWRCCCLCLHICCWHCQQIAAYRSIHSEQCIHIVIGLRCCCCCFCLYICVVIICTGACLGRLKRGGWSQPGTSNLLRWGFSFINNNPNQPNTIDMHQFVIILWYQLRWWSPQQPGGDSRPSSGDSSNGWKSCLPWMR